MAAPRVSQLGGGIAKDDIGASTRTYVSYFEGKNAAGEDAGARKRNYTDVVNKCAPGAAGDPRRCAPCAPLRRACRAGARCDARGR